jgi:acetyl esterase
MNTEIDPDVVAVMDRAQALIAAADMESPEDLRAAFRATVRFLHAGDEPPLTNITISDVALSTPAGPVPVRDYLPAYSDHGDGDVVVLMHGGGWVMGDLDTAHHNAAAIVDALQRRVVSVDYRLAPEHPFPAGLDDCVAVVEHLAAAAPDRSIYLVGDSAGANLAAAVSLRLLRADGPARIRGQLLFYPALDPSQRSAWQELGTDFYLTSESMTFYYNAYLPTKAMRRNELASPILAVSCTGLPPTLIAVAGCDPLQDEGIAYAKQLREAGVEVALMSFATLPHGWLELTTRVRTAREARDQLLTSFRSMIDAERAPVLV